MILGGVDEFAVEYSLSEFYNDDFVGSGLYRLYISGFPYGRNEPDATSFYMIMVGFRHLLEDNILKDNFFSDYSDYEIALNYHNAFYEDIDAKKKMYLGVPYKKLDASFLDLRDYAEEAFDDGSFVLLFCNKTTVKMIGFQIPSGSGRHIQNLHSVVIGRVMFENIIKKAMENILAERREHFQVLHGNE